MLLLCCTRPRGRPCRGHWACLCLSLSGQGQRGRRALRLAGGRAGDCNGGRVVREARGRRMPEARHDEVRVYLVGYDDYIILKADVDEGLELRILPDPADGVVRARDYYHPVLFIDSLFEPLDAHPAPAAVADKGVVEHGPAVVGDDRPERVIYWRLDYDLVARPGEGLD